MGACNRIYLFCCLQVANECVWVGWVGGAYKRQFPVRELEHQICRKCNDPGGGGVVPPSKRLMGMCRWMGSDFWGKTVLPFTVSKGTRMFVLKMTSKVFSIQSKKWVNS